MKQQVITIFGGTGFIGRYVVQQLARAGYRLRVVSRTPDAALSLKTLGDVGQISLIAGNLNNNASLAYLLKDSYAVINLVGILFESGKQRFSSLHAQAAEKLATAAKEAGVERLIYVSALGIDQASGARYAHSKVLGESLVLNAFPNATILRPSVVFGPDDNFFNQFATLARIAPALPLIGGGNTIFQPVYVGDVAQAIETCLSRPNTQGNTYELGGPHTYTFRQILEYILLLTGRSRPFIRIPFCVASALGFMAEFSPRPAITRDQIKLLKQHNVVSHAAKTFAHLDITPTAVEMIVPEYLARFHKKTAA